MSALTGVVGNAPLGVEIAHNDLSFYVFVSLVGLGLYVVFKVFSGIVGGTVSSVASSLTGAKQRCGHAVLLIGPQYSGKTAILHRLFDGEESTFQVSCRGLNTSTSLSFKTAHRRLE